MLEIFGEAGLKLSNGKFDFPLGIKRVKIDVGLSVNAPQSQTWINADPDVFVLGFEPLNSNLNQIKQFSSFWEIKLQPKHIGKQIALLRTALYSRHLPEGLLLYVTKDDPGCSSLLEPKTFEVDHVEPVEVWSLDDILNYFPFERFPVIDHVKINTQGADYEILKGLTRHLDRIFAITIEIDTTEYKDSTNSKEVIVELLEKYGYFRFKSGIISNLKFLLKGYKIDVETDDPTFINTNQIHLSKIRRFLIFQRG